MLKGSWKIPLTILPEDRWLKLGKDIWLIIFEMCIRDDINESYAFYTGATNSIRLSCKTFAIWITPHFLLTMIYSNPLANLESYITIRVECDGWFCDCGSLSPYRQLCTGFIDKQIPNPYKDKKHIYLRMKWCWNRNNNQKNEEGIFSIRKRDRIREVWRPK